VRGVAGQHDPPTVPHRHRRHVVHAAHTHHLAGRHTQLALIADFMQTVAGAQWPVQS
jgi:hypothetical protein